MGQAALMAVLFVLGRAGSIKDVATNDARYWIDLARYDLRAAKAMLKAKHRLYVGFLCHLAIEKTLKAYWSPLLVGPRCSGGFHKAAFSPRPDVN
jgi:hypothetical protein